MPKTKARKAISKTTRFEIFKRDLFACQYCGARPPAVVLQVDHIVAVANGGSNDRDNFVTACQPCNIGKGVRELSAIPQSLSDRAAETAEREAQLLGYQAIMEAQRERLDDETWRVIEALENRPVPDWPQRDFQSVRMFVQKIGLMSAIESAEAAANRNASKPFKYFCALCWAKIKGES